MFDLGLGELMVIGVVALILIGPKDLPKMFQTMGRFTAKMRAMAREFTSAMESAAEESGVKDVAKDLRAVTSPTSMGLDKVNEAMNRFESWDPLKDTKPKGNPTLSAAPKPSATPALAQAPTTTTAPPPPPASPVVDDKPRGPATAGLANPAPVAAPRQPAAKDPDPSSISEPEE